MDHLQTEARNPASSALDRLTTPEFVRLMSEEDAKAVAAVATQAEAVAQAIEVITERLRRGGRLVYAGAGTSGRLGVLDATECPPTFNAPPGQVVGVIAGGPEALTRAVEGAEDHPEFAERDLRAINLGPDDALVGIATSGRTPYVLGALAYARSVGAYAIGFSCNEDSEVARAADLAVTPVVGPEVLSGSTRLKAGTATKLVLNMLSTGAMVRLGKTYGNLMVDLRATNTKLRARANRIVRTLTGLDVDRADQLLKDCNGELKTAILSHVGQIPPEEARNLLDQSGGRITAALESSPLPRTRGRGAGGEGALEESVPLTPTPLPRSGGERLKSVPLTPTPLPRSGGEGHDEPSPQPRTDLLLGIDGGGTQTTALLARVTESGPGWTLLGKGTAGPSNLRAVGTDRALAALDDAVAGAFAAAGRTRVPVGAACLGLAGADRPEEQAILQDWTRRRDVAAAIEVTNDAALLLAAGTPNAWGLALIAGTGSIAYGRTADGRHARSGGWGYLFGDEGSGYALVVAALQAVARAADRRGMPTRLTEVFLRRLDLQQPSQLIGTVYGGTWDRTALASLAPLVLDAAQDGDRVADALVNTAVGQLSDLLGSVAVQLDWTGKVPLALAGGVLLAHPEYRERLLDAMPGWDLTPDPVNLVPEPAAGAVTLALRAATSAPFRSLGPHTPAK